MHKLLQHIEETLQGIHDARENLEVLEQLFAGFQKVEKKLVEENKRLQQALAREVQDSSNIRVTDIEVHLVAGAIIQAWTRARQVACLGLSPEEQLLLRRAFRLGWVTVADMPEGFSTAEGTDNTSPEEEQK